MSSEPEIKRAVVFIDGQNLFYAVKSAFGYTYPNYDVVALAKFICQTQNWKLEQVRFYTGIPHISDHPEWNYFLSDLSPIPVIYSKSSEKCSLSSSFYPK